jgi:hypothetical protein
MYFWPNAMSGIKLRKTDVRVCSTHGRDDKFMDSFSRKT